MRGTGQATPLSKVTTFDHDLEETPPSINGYERMRPT
jgi:hypothetical protein